MFVAAVFSEGIVEMLSVRVWSTGLVPFFEFYHFSVVSEVGSHVFQ